MKNLKIGFTLAEVLITLAIIGVVAAITLPNLIVSNQYKSIGVKLAKMMSTTEQAARAYVGGDDAFTVANPQAVSDFVTDTFLFTDLYNRNGKTGDSYNGSTRPSTLATESIYYFADKQDSVPTDPTISLSQTYSGELKDGTLIHVAMCATTETNDNGGQATETTNINPACDYTNGSTDRGKGIVGGRKVGEPVYTISFDPNVKGVPVKTHRNYTFVVTELGFMYPAADESCLWKIYKDKFITPSATFKEGDVCYGETRTKQESANNIDN